MNAQVHDAAQAAATDITYEIEARRRLAFDAYHQISCLAGGMKRLIKEEGYDDAELYLGMLSRIQHLSDIIFHASRLDGTDGEGWGDRDNLDTLASMFEGRFA